MGKSIKTAARPSEVRYWCDRSWACRMLMEAIERVAPDVVDELRCRLLLRFTASAPASKEAALALGKDDDKVERLATVLEPAVREWAADHGLLRNSAQVKPSERGAAGLTLVNWMTRVVVYSFLDWAFVAPTAKARWVFPEQFSLASQWFDTPPVFEFRIDGWPATRESAATFRSRARTAFDAALDEYLKQLLPDEKRRSRADRGERPRLPPQIHPHHFEWLVRHQMLGKSFSQIAREDSPDRSEDSLNRINVGKRIRAAAEQVIGPNYSSWLREPPRGGRPRAAGRPRVLG